MCAIIGLDIPNAFNTARWDEIMLALEGLSVPLNLRRVISSYLTDRTLLYDTDDGTHSYKITGDMSQSSILGSPIWNILYDGLLRQPLPEGVSIVAFADHIALIVIEKSIEDLQYLGDTAMGVEGDWLIDDELSLAAKKTEAVLIARTKKRVYATFTVNDEKIRTRDIMKYLGVIINTWMSFKDHLTNAGLK